MDIASLLSIIGGIAMVIFGVLSSNSFDITAMQMYIDPASVVITFGGSICSTLGCFKLADGINGFKSISLPFKDKTYDPSQTIRTIIEMSNVGRKEGLLALEEAANGIEDEFLKKGIMLVVDGTDPELVRGILETDMMCLETRHKDVIKFWAGPTVLSASAHLKPGKSYSLVLDLKPALDEGKLDARFLRDLEAYANRSMENALADLFPHSMIPVLLRG